MKRTRIVDALKLKAQNQEVTVAGWVRTHRSSKAVDFIALNDGSTINNIQVVVDPSSFDAELLKQITTGSCISATGLLVESPASGQAVELQCKEVKLLGACPSDYPMQKKGQTFEYATVRTPASAHKHVWLCDAHQAQHVYCHSQVFPRPWVLLLSHTHHYGIRLRGSRTDVPSDNQKPLRSEKRGRR